MSQASFLLKTSSGKNHREGFSPTEPASQALGINARAGFLKILNERVHGGGR